MVVFQDLDFPSQERLVRPFLEISWKGNCGKISANPQRKWPGTIFLSLSHPRSKKISRSKVSINLAVACFQNFKESRMMNRLALVILKLYQYLISPWLPRSCRFFPTCSQYCKELFIRFPFHKALWYACRRVFKCHPYCAGGVDLPPGDSRSGL